MATPAPSRVRREPPPFRRVAVARVDRLGPRMIRVTFTSPELEGLVIADPAASVRLLLLDADSGELVLPTWRGNDYRYADGRRATLRTFTPRHHDPERNELVLDIVDHDGGGAAVAWVRAARPGDPAAISGPARGYPVDPAASAFLLAGDETAIPAIGQLLERLPAGAEVRALVEVATRDARLPLPARPGATVQWLDADPGGVPGDALVRAVREAPIDSGTRVFAAGEAAAMQRIRRHLFEERGLPRAQAFVRGYWKHGRPGDGDDG